MGDSLDAVTHSPEETFALGKRLAGRLRSGDVVALTGDLGTGKTVLVQGICAGLGVQEPVTSPTFTLVQEYRGTVPVAHIDFYRLHAPGDIAGLDPDGIFESGAVVLIEWAERGLAFVPQDAIDVRMERILENGTVSESKRLIRIRAPGSERPLG